MFLIHSISYPYSLIMFKLQSLVMSILCLPSSSVQLFSEI